METTDFVEFKDNLLRAAGFDANKTYPHLFQHLGYRKLIAEQLLHESDSLKIAELTEMYNRINNEIKLIIGVK